ncbi:hypothetical protein JCM5350_001279 [Sporobolomyces pararoseus]
MSSSDAASLSLPSPLSSPSLRSSPFSVLPPELTQLIIEHTVPHSFHSETYGSRQSTLRTLCLVSKSFHHFAKPLLFAVVCFKTEDQVVSWATVQEQQSRRLLTREIVVNPNTYKSISFDRRFDGHQKLKLSILRICGFNVVATSSLKLDSLHELGLFHVDFKTPLSNFVNSTTLPSLRRLAYYSDTGSDLTLPETLKSILASLQLVSLPLDIAASLEPALLEELNEITLVDTEDQPIEEILPIKYLRVSSGSEGLTEEYLEDLIIALESTSARLPTAIYLPHTAEPDPGAMISDAVGSVYTTFVVVCIALGTELVYEEQPRFWYLNSGFSEHFIARVEKEKGKEHQE